MSAKNTAYLSYAPFETLGTVGTNTEKGEKHDEN